MNPTKRFAGIIGGLVSILSYYLNVRNYLFIRIQQKLIQGPQQIRIIQEATGVDFNFRQGIRHERQT